MCNLDGKYNSDGKCRNLKAQFTVKFSKHRQFCLDHEFVDYGTVNTASELNYSMTLQNISSPLKRLMRWSRQQPAWSQLFPATPEIINPTTALKSGALYLYDLVTVMDGVKGIRAELYKKTVYNGLRFGWP